MAAIVVRPARILHFEVTSRPGVHPTWLSIVSSHPFFFTLDPVRDEHPHARIGLEHCWSQNVRGRGRMLTSIAGKSVVVTGASKGIG
jgi:hypothetical protein